MEVKNNNLKVGDVVVSTWGATMLLADFGIVVKLSPKSAVIESLESRMVDTEGYGQPLVAPFEDLRRKHIQRQHGVPERIRIYKKIYTHAYGPSEEVWFSKIRKFAKIYDKWDGQPVKEDHND